MYKQVFIADFISIKEIYIDGDGIWLLFLSENNSITLIRRAAKGLAYGYRSAFII